MIMYGCKHCDNEVHEKPSYCPDCGNEWECGEPDFPIEIVFNNHRDSHNNSHYIDEHFPQYSPDGEPMAIPNELWDMLPTVDVRIRMYEDLSYEILSVNGYEVNRS